MSKFQISPEIELASAVVTDGTMTFSYPSGYGRGDFVGGSGNVLLVGARATSRNAFEEGKDFLVSLGASSITVTWKNAATIAAGSVAVLQLAEPGAQVDNPVYPPRVQRVAENIVLLQLGNPATSDDDYFRANAAVAGAGALTLLQTTLDVPRNVIITSAGNDTGITFAVVGEDEYGVEMDETITGANAGIAAGKKAFKSITSITASGAAAGNVKIGFGDVLGLPIWVPSAAHVLKELEDDAAPSAGTFVGGLALGTIPSATSADVRGTYDPNSAANGTKAFALLVWVNDPTFKGSDQYA